MARLGELARAYAVPMQSHLSESPSEIEWVKALCPDVNIVVIDYDPGASRVNQENRLKLMLANAGDRV